MSALDIGISGLLAAQRQLSVASHNIANAGTEGYSRQRAELVTHPPQFHGFGYLGSGVNVAAISRMHDQFSTRQVWEATAGLAQAEQFESLAGRINDLLGTGESGLPASLQSFFDAVQGLANDPSSRVSRQLLIGEAQTLASQFRDLDARLEAVTNDVHAMLDSAVREINDFSASIARLNRQIATASTVGQTPNDLLDQRDELVRRLAERVSVTTTVQDNGMMNVFVGNGQAVVVGGDARALATVPDPADPSRREVAYVSGDAPVVISSQLGGGKLGGILDFRAQILEPTKDSLDRMAFGVTEAFNRVHRGGMDLQGEAGGDFFRPLGEAGPPPTAEVIPHGQNDGEAALDVAFTDPDAVRGGTYQLVRHGDRYTLTRQVDGHTFSLGDLGAGPVTVDGMQLTLASGELRDGDRLLIRPLGNAARNVAVGISDPDRIAAAAPVRAGASPGNGGSGRIGQPALADPAAWNGGPVHLIMTDADADGVADGWRLQEADGTVLADGGWQPGQPIEAAGLRFELEGEPLPGDAFVIEPNVGGASDNRNALALADLQTAQTLDGGRATFQAFYGNLVGDVGGRSLQAEISASVQAGLLERATDRRESVSGVNLDEEAADIMRYQQAYQAAAQLIAIANSTFQSLIDAVRR